MVRTRIQLRLNPTMYQWVTPFALRLHDRFGYAPFYQGFYLRVSLIKGVEKIRIDISHPSASTPYLRRERLSVKPYRHWESNLDLNFVVRKGVEEGYLLPNESCTLIIRRITPPTKTVLKVAVMKRPLKSLN